MNRQAYVSYLIGGLRASIDATDEEIIKKAKDKMKREGASATSLHFQVFKKSIDARKKENIAFVCTVLVKLPVPVSSKTQKALSALNAKQLVEAELSEEKGSAPLTAPPLVVGMGPAGLFAALLLAQNGYAPILIDRGAGVEERTRAVEQFRERGILNTECNIQFGAGGAGTFSDGKLITRIHDGFCSYVLDTLVKFGAPKDILIKAKPHVGTDLLRRVVDGILSEIERLGGTLLYHCRMDGFAEKNDGTVQVFTSRGEFCCGAMVLALGHSARDTYQYLIRRQFAVEAKPISVGLRIEHRQEDIDRALYGKWAGHPSLGPAEYALSDTQRERGVYTFCMCPGGEVVAASSEEGHLVVNGMSYHARNLPNANSAVAVSVRCSDYEAVNGSTALGAIEFQRRIERNAFLQGGGEYTAPLMTVGDFLSGKTGTEPSEVLPSYRNGKVRCADFGAVLPPFVCEYLRYGLTSFGKKLKGFDSPTAVLTAAETRTSAPLRILRTPDTMTAIGHNRIYPCGEGAGYAGGITSAGVDGVRVAMALMKCYAPPKSL